ncbi:MAG: RIP metalloprotease RseP [Bacteroidetes bacterium]|nr:RIP metalloprotease RseP [Bacteroidota bacterium]
MIKFTLFFISLSLLIVLHEFGHYIAARMFKTKVNKFYLFFDFLFPFSNVLKFTLFKKKLGDTEYGIGWFPFGGYVDIDGMMGDPDDKLGKAPEPHEFRAKKPWQRLIILAGGITVNFLLAIVIFSFVSWSYGESYLPAKNAKFGIYVDPIGEKIGLRNGDKVVSLDNVPVTDLHKAAVAILLDKPKSIQVERNGEKTSLLIPEGFDLQVVDKEVMLFDAGFPFVIDSVVPETGAALAGFKKGDRLVSLESDSILFFQQFSRLFKENKGKTVSVGFVRNGKMDSANLIVKEDGSIGAYYQPQYTYFDISKQEFGFIESWGQGWNRTISVLGNYVKQFRLIFSKVGASKMGGFASIGKMYPSSWDWEAFWTTTAVISVILAFMNLLPIPVLDGGYILFILWEMITGKKVGDKFMQRALTIGMYFVLALLIFSNGNDIVRALR